MKIFKIATVKNGKFISNSPNLLEVEGQYVADTLEYQLGKWTEALPNSVGIFVFRDLKDALAWYEEGKEVILECEYKGILRPIYWIPKRAGSFTKKRWKEILSLLFSKNPKDIENMNILTSTPQGTYVVDAIKPIEVIYPIRKKLRIDVTLVGDNKKNPAVRLDLYHSDLKNVEHRYILIVGEREDDIFYVEDLYLSPNKNILENIAVTYKRRDVILIDFLHPIVLKSKSWED